MFGTVLAIVKTSACSWVPSAAASRVERRNPLSRLTAVPEAITALDDRSERCSAWVLAAGSDPGFDPVAGPLTTRPRPAAPPDGATARGWLAGAGPAGRSGSRLHRTARP